MTAAAAPFSFTLNPNPDNTRDTAHPCLATDQSDCKSLASLLACDNSAAPSLVGMQTGNAYSANYRQFFSGSLAAGSTLSVQNVPGSVTDATTQWSISSAGAGNNLVNGGSVAGSGGLKVRGTSGAISVDCATQNWSYVAPPSSDTTPPNPVTGIACTPGTNQVTCSWDLTNDPNDAVQRKGVGTYRIKLNGSTVDTLAAPTAGLVNDFTGTAIGTSVTGSATQGSGATGGKWTVATTGTAAFGLENHKDDAIYEATTPVAGSTPCVYGQIAAIPNNATYNKAFVDLRNSTSQTSAHLAAVVLRQGSVYVIQYSIRPADGGQLTTSTNVTLTGVPYLAECIGANLATIYYSYDGGAWTPAFSGIAITLNDSKVAGCGSAATNDGTAGVAISIDFTYCQVTSAGRASKVVTSNCTVTCLWKMTAIDLETTPNESILGGGVSAIPIGGGGGGGSQKKWHPGYYVTVWHDDNHWMHQSVRFSEYDEQGSNTHIQGWYFLPLWSQLEGATHGDYTAGKALIASEIAHLKAEVHPMRLMIGPLVKANYSFCGPVGSPNDCENYAYPTYIKTAGCIKSGNDGYGNITQFQWWVPACAQYMIDLYTAYAAQFDAEPYFEGWEFPYETITGGPTTQNAQYSDAASEAGLEHIAAGAIAAFPHTNIWFTINWHINQAYTAQLIAYLDSIGAGSGNGDTLPGVPNQYFGDDIREGLTWNGSAWTTTGGHDYRGHMLGITRVEASELGYGAVDGPNGLTPAQIYTHWNDDMQVSHGIMERNVVIGWDDRRFYACHNNDYPNGVNFNQYCGNPGTAGGLLNLINTTPLTHTACPTGYDQKFGNGSAGSGCNTN